MTTEPASGAAKPPPKTWIDFGMHLIEIYLDKAENGDFGENQQKIALEAKVSRIHMQKKFEKRL